MCFVVEAVATAGQSAHNNTDCFCLKIWIFFFFLHNKWVETNFWVLQYETVISHKLSYSKCIKTFVIRIVSIKKLFNLFFITHNDFTVAISDCFTCICHLFVFLFSFSFSLFHTTHPFSISPCTNKEETSKSVLSFL